MRRVIVIDGNKEFVLHSAHSKEQIFNDEWSEEMGKTPTFSFLISPEHENVGHLIPLASEVKIIDGGKTEFYGRIITPQKDIYNTGTIQCIGGLSYLADSVQRPFVRKGNIYDFLEYVLLIHNSMVEDRKKLKLGIVNVVGADIERIIEGYPDTLTVLNEYLVKEYGGYLRAREEVDGRYLDYLEDYGGYNSQVVRFGENLIDLSSQIDASELITCLIPTGASVEVDNGDGTTSEYVVSISEVNNGKDYIVNQMAIDNGNGYIWGSVQFDGITDPEVLMSLSERYLKEKSTFPEHFEVTAFDLSHVDLEMEAFELGKWTRFESKPHNISATYLLKKQVRHITAPQNDKIVFGGARDTISGTTANSAKRTELRIEQMKQTLGREMNRKVENATQLIMGGLGGYVVIGRAEDGHPEEILIMDAPNKENAENVIRLNKNGLGFSNAGYKGPYQNAWTIDGNLVADFITTGTMLADRIRGGSLVLGGEDIGRDGEIVILDEDGEEIGRWDKDGFEVGEFRVSAGNLYEIVSADGTFRAATGNYPGGKTGVLEIRSKNGNDWAKIVGGSISTSGVMSASAFSGTSQSASYMYDLRLGKSWWGGWTISQTVHKLWNKVNKLAEIIDDQWNDHSGIYDALERWDDRNDDASSW